MKFLKPTTVTDSIFVSSTAAEADYSAWSATTLYAAGDNVIVTTGSHRKYLALVGSKATVTMTIAAPCVVTWTGHTLAADTPIVFTTTGALPTGLTAGTTYYVKTPVAGATFNVAASAGGAAITTTGTQSGTHTCGLASNYNKSPVTNATAWVDIGPTNRWAMFDTSSGTITSQATPLTVVLAPGIVNSLALLDLAGTSVVVSMKDGLAGPTVYNQTYTLGDGAELLDWYDYFFADIEPQTELIVDDLPPYSTGHITVTINAATTAQCGTMAVGSMVTLGNTRMNVSVGIIDYSAKTTDAYGATSVVERSYAKKIDVPVFCENKRLDYITKQLAAVRATPCVWIANDNGSDYSALVAYGFYRDWSVTIPYRDYSEMNLSIEGLA